MNEGLAYDREVYEGLDPRFRVSVTATERGKHFYLRPVEDVTATFYFARPFVESGKYHTLFGRGLPVKLEPGEVKAEGSLLLRDVFERATKCKAVLQVSQRFTMGLGLARVDRDGQEVGRIAHLPCQVEGGDSEFRFVARTDNGMLKLSSHLSSGQTGPSTADFSYSFRPWYGRPICNLPCFDAFCALFADLSDGDRLILEFHYEGDRLPGGYMAWGGAEADGLSDLVEIVKRARWIAERFKINPILPDLDELTWNGIEAIHSILHGGQIETGCDECKYETTISGKTAEDFFRLVTDQEGSFRLQFDRAFTLPFLGQDLHLGLVAHDLNGMKLGEELPDLKRKFEAGDGEIRVPFVGSKSTKLILKIADEPAVQVSDEGAAAEGAGPAL